MKTLTEEKGEEQPKMMTEVNDNDNNEDHFPSEITDNILSRLPVKSILRSKSVSKQWHSLISHPSFTKLHFSRATSSLSISAYDKSTKKHHLLSAPSNGGPVTHLMTLDEVTGSFISGFTHLKGFVFFTSQKLIFTKPDKSLAVMKYQAYVINPSTRKVFKLPPPPGYNVNDSDEYGHLGYLFGFDESAKEHKILHMRCKGVWAPRLTFEFLIFSMSGRSWRKIDVEAPDGFDWNRLTNDLNGGVCANGVVYVVLMDMSYDILAFDFVTEKFSVLSIPQGVVPRPHEVTFNALGFMKVNVPSVVKVDGCIGLVVHDQERSELRTWLLRDFDKREWVKETAKFPETWNKLVGYGHLPVDVNMDGEIVFSVCKLSENVIKIPVYNIKSKSFKTLRFTLEDQFLCSKNVDFGCIKCYVESIMAL